MSSIAVLRTKKAESRQGENSHAKSGDRPISLLAFLQTENIKLQNSVFQLEIEIMALRKAVQVLRSQQNGAAQGAAP